MTSIAHPTPEVDGTRIRQRQRQGLRTLLAIFAVCIAPVFASYTAFYVWRPERLRVHGELVRPPQATDLDLLGAPTVGLRGKWVLVFTADAACAKACEEALYNMRQVRTALGPEMERVARLWIATGETKPSAKLLAQHPGLIHVQGKAPAKLLELPGRIALIDPQGYLMMRFPTEAEPKRMVKDLARLLKYSPMGWR